MNPIDKRTLLATLRSIDRLQHPPSSRIYEFIDHAWEAMILPLELKFIAKELYKHITLLTILEEDADETQMMFNYYFYAIADLANYFSEGDTLYLVSAKE